MKRGAYKGCIFRTIWPAILAARFAQELRLPAGNLWEPGIAAQIAELRAAGHSEDDVEAAFRLRLGLRAQ